MSDAARVEMEVRDRIAVLTLQDPPANCYSYELMRQLDDRILEARFDPLVDVIVLRGAGEKFFCAGADIGMLEEADPVWKYNFCLHANETLSRLEHTPKLVIAAINGHCVGGGLEVALACDLRLARKGSGRCGLPEVSLGVIPGMGGSQRMARAVGKAKAMDLILTGRMMDAEEAERSGLVSRIVPSAELLDEAIKAAETISSYGKPSTMVAKEAVDRAFEMSLAEGVNYERRTFFALFATHDQTEGMDAFSEKRPPQFSGR